MLIASGFECVQQVIDNKGASEEMPIRLQQCDETGDIYKNEEGLFNYNILVLKIYFICLNLNN